MTSTHDPGASPRATSFLICPRCGLSIRPRSRWLAIEHCPRCLARARVAVSLFRSPLPPAELYGAGSAPTFMLGRGTPKFQRAARRRRSTR